MKILRQIDDDYRLSVDWLWQKHENENIVEVFDAPDKTYACFGIFLVDRLKLSEKKILDTIHDSLTQEFKYWNENYPWSELSNFKLRFEELPDSTPYLYGYKCTQDNTIEQNAVIVGILHKIAQGFGPEVFVKICDTDGDFILAGCNETVPEEFNYPIANNRLWLHDGKFKLIPTYFYPDRGLTWSECIEFLGKAHYKLITDEKLMKEIDNKYINSFPQERLDDLQLLKVKIGDERCLEILKDNPAALNFIVKQFHTNDVEVPNISKYNGKGEECTFLVSKVSLDLLSLYMDSRSLKEDKENIESYSGEIISLMLKKLLEDKTLSVQEVDNVNTNSVERYKNTTFSNFNFKDRSLLDTIKLKEDMVPDQESFNKVLEFLSKSGTPQENRKQNVNSHSSLDARNPDVEAKDFFKSENIDIDDDDFFEFFLKDGLKLPQEKIDELQHFNSDSATLDENSVENDKFLDAFADVVDNNDIDEGIMNAINESMKWLSVEGMEGAPFDHLKRYMDENGK
ncbi:similar to Kazachstania africana KAFR_0H02500 hypothetical protein [Maudiozyma saulgeensis]|uniref:Uncharacterized protein n=1 Tax=Maudiozyma saulgeensis TaxID=1789683 RepID=A0A1X7R9J2_9SACH|nr:similar to Kazachstania africana KAFR_0H02500 hypothetical protein [Kazachstania saulgeensis]